MNSSATTPIQAESSAPSQADIGALPVRLAEMVLHGNFSEAHHLIGLALQAGVPAPVVAPFQQQLAELDVELGALFALFNSTQYDEFDAASAAWTARFPAHAFGWKLAGASLLGRGMTAKALEPLSKAAWLAPTDPEAQVNYANALFMEGQSDAAQSSYRQALAASPDAMLLIANFVQFHVDAGQRGKAEDLMELVGAIASGDFTLAMLHGGLLYQDGRWKEALAYYERALSIAPDNAAANGNLAACHKQLWNLPEAEHFGERAVALDGNNFSARNNYAAVLMELHRFAEAEAQLREVLSQQPQYSPARHNLGMVLKEQFKFEEAMQHFEAAHALDPDNADILANIADLTSREYGIDDARALYERALALDPACAIALVGMGSLLKTVGKFDEAEAYFLKTIGVRPDLAQAWVGIAHSRKITRADTALLTALNDLLAQGQSPTSEAALAFAAGKAHNDLKQYDEAFAFFHRANEIAKNFGERYAPEQQVQFTDSLCQVYSALTLRLPREGASRSRRPVLVVGMPRSGTSLTEQIIASHPQAYGAGELEYWNRAALRCAPVAGGQPLNDDLVRSIAEGCLERLQDCSQDALRVVDKMPANYYNVGLIHSVFPDARIIHIRRNPIDTCLSIYFQNFNTHHSYAKDLHDLAHRYREYHRLMQHWKAVLPPGAMLEIDYEDLVADQEAQSRRLIEFVDLPWDDRCLQFHETERRVGTASNWQVRQKIYNTSKERWRHYEKHVGPLLPLLELWEQR